MRFDILTLFPEVCAPYLASSILGRAQAGKHITVGLHNIRDFAVDKHHTTDDTPYGGGAGMVMKIEPIDRALQSLAATTPRAEQHVIVLSAKGTPFTQAKAAQYAAAGKNLVLICGRYEGVDQRVMDHLADEELSIGPYVLAGGELAALVVVEAVARLVPGVLGNPDSLKEESHGPASMASQASEAAEALAAPEATLEYPQYTKPEVYQDWRVPEVLLSGNHEAIRQWRETRSERKA